MPNTQVILKKNAFYAKHSGDFGEKHFFKANTQVSGKYLW
jgi:hypothetical protein